MPWSFRLDDVGAEEYGQDVRRHLALLIAAGSVLGLGATALAQGGDGSVAVQVPTGCLSGTRVLVRIVPPSGTTVSPVRIHAVGHEVVRLTGISSEASVTVRLPRHGGTVTVSGETTGGKTFSRTQTYRACAPRPTVNRTPRPLPPQVTGGGEG
jgi:hypothetical protein